jgi:hypothetical protein
MGFYVVLFLIVMFLILQSKGQKLFAAKVARPAKPAKPSPKVTPKGLAYVAGAVGVIALCEYLSPSSRLTGYDPKPSLTPTQMLNERPPTAVPPTIDALSQSADWLWALGTLTEQDIRDRLVADINTAQIKAREALSGGNQNTDVAELSYQRARDYRHFSLVAEGLGQVLNDLDTFLQGTPIAAPDDGQLALSQLDLRSGPNVDQFILSQLKEWARFKTDENRRIMQEANARLNAFDKAGLTPDDLRQNETYVALRDQVDHTRNDWFAASGVMSNVRTNGSYLDQLVQIIQQDTSIPAMTRVIPMQAWDNRRIRPSIEATVVEGPSEGGSLAHFAQRVNDAVNGYQRSATRHHQTLRCGLGFEQSADGPVLTPQCETAMVLPIDYDVTGLGCTDLTLGQANLDTMNVGTVLVAHQACKESWIFPHLNIVFRPTTFTVYPPVPSELSATPTAMPVLSRWILVWNGKLIDLNGPTTVDWDGTPAAFDTFKLIHRPHPDTQSPRIWDDFRLSRAATAPLELMTAAAYQDTHAFDAVHIKPVQKDDIINKLSNFMAYFLGQARPSRNGLDLTSEYLRQAIAEINRKLTSRHSTQDDSSPDDAHFCALGRMRLSSTNGRLIDEAIETYAQMAGDAPCHTLATAQVILRYAERLQVAGSWLWMVD